MCGIAGIVDPGSNDLPDRIAAMRDALAHRGPDGIGAKVWDEGVALGHRRLSIIDLSVAGAQPMSNETGDVWITFNGEIYNHRELHSELEARGHVFASRCDTEVIIHAYEEWGDAHVHRLRGMFAYALYDRRQSAASGHAGRLLLVRDRLGIKPLVYSEEPHGIHFASEIKALLCVPRVSRSIDRTAVFDFLTYLYVPAPKTAYQHIRKLPPAHMLVWEEGVRRIVRYWDVDVSAAHHDATDTELVGLLQGKLSNAVSSHMVSDVPVGVFLSGGIDSSAVTAFAARKAMGQLKTFSIGFDVLAHDETAHARAVARHLGTDHHERTVAADSLELMLPRVLDMYDEPFADASAIPTFRVSQLARESVKVVLTGDGGDEVFAGYNWYQWWLAGRSSDALPRAIRHGPARWLARSWPRWLPGQRLRIRCEHMQLDPLEHYAALMEAFTPSQKRALLGPEGMDEFAGYDDYWAFRAHWRPDLDPLTNLQYVDLHTYLPDDILTKVDRASMAVSLEARPPLLDHELVEFAFTLPRRFKIHGPDKKRGLKQAVAGMLPAGILARPKKGFSSPLNNWLSLESKSIREQLTSNARMVNVDRLKDRGRSLPGSRLWNLIVLESWMERLGHHSHSLQ